MVLYAIILRLVHIVAATLWTGAAVMIAGFLTPAVRATGPEGGKVMQRLVQHGRLPLFMNTMAWLATVSGLLLYWQVSGGLQSAWITSPQGLGFTIGAVAGLLAFIVGEAVNSRAASRLGAIGREIQSAGGPPTPAQMAEIQAAQERLRMGGILGASLLVVAAALMAVARLLW